jgi:hypothetical protein
MFSLHSPEDLLKLHGEIESLQRDFHRYQAMLGGQNRGEEPALRSALIQRFTSIEDELNRLGVVRVSMIDGHSRQVGGACHGGGCDGRAVGDFCPPATLRGDRPGRFASYLTMRTFLGAAGGVDTGNAPAW